MSFVCFSLNYDVKNMEIISRFTVPMAVNILRLPRLSAAGNYGRKLLVTRHIRNANVMIGFGPYRSSHYTLY